DSVRALYDAVNAAGEAPSSQAVEPMRHWVAKNQEFHALIYSASSNTSLERIICDLHVDYTRNILNMTVLGMYESRMRKNIEHHSAIVDAMVARDPAGSRHAMRTHIQESGEFVVDWLEKRPALMRSRSGRRH
ncbi:MAG: FCD domain-containing protein, partial [Pseudomonadales bacterium]